jgi:hypothetical protein
MTGDPYYLRYYNADYLRFKPLVTPDAEQALANLQAIHTKYGLPLGTSLVPLFGYSDPHTLEDLLAAMDSPDVAFKPEIIEVPRDDFRWKLFLSLIPDLKVIITWLKAVDFDGDWEANYLPGILANAKALKTELSKYNLFPLMEKYLHQTLPFDHFTIYLSQYTQPFGMGIDVNVSWIYSSMTLEGIVDITIHESLHFLVEGRVKDPGLWEALSFLKNDEFYMANFQAHDPSLGYNDLDTYIEEDIVEALDQYLADKAGVAQDPVTRWKAAPAHMQTFTPVIYSLLKQENFEDGNETFQTFMIHMVREGRLKAGMIESARSDFFANWK